MRMHWQGLVMAAALACTWTAPGQAQNKPESGCNIPRYTTRGGTSEVAITVVHDGGWCTATWNAPRGAVGNAEITARPAHGEARTDGNGGTGHWAYRPAPGYTGPDTFTVALYGGTRNLAVNVTVLP